MKKTQKIDNDQILAVGTSDFLHALGNRLTYLEYIIHQFFYILDELEILQVKNKLNHLKKDLVEEFREIKELNIFLHDLVTSHSKFFFDNEKQHICDLNSILHVSIKIAEIKARRSQVSITYENKIKFNVNVNRLELINAIVSILVFICDFYSDYSSGGYKKINISIDSLMDISNKVSKKISITSRLLPQFFLKVLEIELKHKNHLETSLSYSKYLIEKNGGQLQSNSKNFNEFDFSLLFKEHQ